MKLERYFKYVSTNIKYYYPLYAHKIKPDIKWGDFEGQNTQNVLIEGSHRKSDSAEKRYKSIRKKQFIAL